MINGGLMNRTSDTPAPVITVQVDSIDDALKKVEAGGGSTVQPRTEISGMGAFGYFKDSEGNVMESLGDVRLDALPERASPRVSAPLRWVRPQAFPLRCNLRAEALRCRS